MRKEFISFHRGPIESTAVIRKKEDFFFWKKIRNICEREKIKTQEPSGRREGPRYLK